MSRETKLVECFACGGTGLYIEGPRLHDGTATVCLQCKGTGATTITYTPFTVRKIVPTIRRVYEATENRDVYCGKHTFGNGRTIDYSKYGCQYEEWLRGVEPKPIPDDPRYI